MEWALLPFKRYSAFEGRSRRKEFWLFHLLFVVVSVVAGVIDRAVGLGGLVLGVYGPLTLLTYLVFLMPSLSVSARRLHDTERSAWWILLYLLPAIGLVLISRGSTLGGLLALGCLVLIVFFALDGTRGSNRFGADPKEAGRAPGEA